MTKKDWKTDWDIIKKGLTETEQEMICRVLTEKDKYRHPEADPPHEQDNIPNAFDILTREELQYVQDNPHLLKLIKPYY